jgi:hypothetical protein
MSQAVLSFLSVLLGGLITWFASRHFYKKASDDLRNEAEVLHSVNEVILLSLEEANLVTLYRDSDDRITAFAFGSWIDDHVKRMADIRWGREKKNTEVRLWPRRDKNSD